MLVIVATSYAPNTSLCREIMSLEVMSGYLPS